jgi:hypothetical protein
MRPPILCFSSWSTPRGFCCFWLFSWFRLVRQDKKMHIFLVGIHFSVNEKMALL